MPKVTVYVPDGLLERVRKLDPEVNMSALFQQAIQSEAERLEIQQGTVSTVRERVNIAALKAKFLAAKAEQVEHERAAYRAGYQWGLDHAEALPYETFEAIGYYGWGAEAIGVVSEQLAADLTEVADAWRPDGSLVNRGAEDALKAVWDTINAELAEK
jgi:hypothetical protein